MVDWWAWLRRWHQRTRATRDRGASPADAARPATAEAPLARGGAHPAALNARYRLERLLGRGTVGEVHLAVDRQSGAQVAIKLMPRASTERPQAGPTGSREWQAARRLDHPGIAAVLDAGEAGDQQWLVMAHAPGVPLARYTAASHLLPEPLVLRVGAQVARALAHAHGQGVVHRDLKPSNVLLDLVTGRATLLDFGAARIDDAAATRTGMTLGTPSYMAPEQLAGAQATAAVDTYALGAVLFELLTGRRPHLGATLGELLRAIAGAPAADLRLLRPDLPDGVAEAVMQALATDAGRRPADLSRFADQLDTLADGMAPRGPA